jgi:hypothetical protein
LPKFALTLVLSLLQENLGSISVPFSPELVLGLLDAQHALVTDGLGGVIDGTILEERLPGVLHLHDELTPRLGGAINIEIVRTRAVELTDLFDVLVIKIHNGILLLVYDGVKETDQKVLVSLSSKQLLEAIVNKGINVTVHTHKFKDLKFKD